MMDHDHNLNALHEGGEDSDEKAMKTDENISKEQGQKLSHTPIKSPQPKKLRGKSDSSQNEDASVAILHAIQVLTAKMDEQTLRLVHLFSVHI